MTRLLAAELRRIAARRLVRLTVVLALVGIVLGGAAAFACSGSLTEEAYQQRVAEAKARQEAQDAQIERCLQAHGVDRDGRSPTRSPGSASRPRTSGTSTIPASTGTVSEASSKG